MNSLQLTRGKGRYKRSFAAQFANMRSAKERKRLNPEPLTDEPEIGCYMPPKVKFATVSIACGRERVTFRVHRFGDSLLMRGKMQAASTVGRRVALVLEAILQP